MRENRGTTTRGMIAALRLQAVESFDRRFLRSEVTGVERDLLIAAFSSGFNAAIEAAQRIEVLDVVDTAPAPVEARGSLR